MSPSQLHTADSVALRYLMTETIFGIAKDAGDAAVEQPMHQPAFKQAAPFSFYGKNGRNYLFLTYEKQHEWMSAVALDAFTKTLTALKLSTDDIAVLNVGACDVFPAEDAIFSFFNPKVLVSLGVSLPWAGLEGSSANPMNYNGITVFRTHTFDEMLSDAEKKRLFWTTIKSLFV